MKVFTCLVLWLLRCVSVQGFSSHVDTTGILFNRPDSHFIQLPQQIDLKPYCPEVKHQGDLFSCVGWAIGYAALTIERAVANHCTDQQVITHNASSALFIFNQLPREKGPQGSRLTDAIAFLEANGDCLARHFDADVNNGKKQPTEELMQAACAFRIASAKVLFTKNEKPDAKVQRTKAALACQKPVTVGMAVRRNFLQLINALYWWPDLGDTTPAGGHALVVVGYDDRKKAFQLMNSWGKEWGKGGFIWIKYEAFGQFCKFGCVLNLD